MKLSSSDTSGRPGSYEPASRAPGGPNDPPRESSPPKASALRALTVIEEHTTRVALAMEHGLAEGDAVSALARLRREVNTFQDHLVKARLEHFREGDSRQRARAAEVLDLLESRCLSNLQNAGLTAAQAGHRDEGKQ